jgi:hypothetical protein
MAINIGTRLAIPTKLASISINVEDLERFMDFFYHCYENNEIKID